MTTLENIDKRLEGLTAAVTALVDIVDRLAVAMERLALTPRLPRVRRSVHGIRFDYIVED